MTEQLISKSFGRPYPFLCGNNRLSLIGIIGEKFSWSHKNCKGEKFFKTNIIIPRPNGLQDTMKMVVSERVIGDIPKDDFLGKQVKVTGRLSSYLHPEPNCWLEVYVFAKYIQFYEGEEKCNKVYLQGYVSKPTVLRKTHQGQLITELFLGVKRENYDESTRDFFPCFVWHDLANYAKELEVGTDIWIKGRIKTRKYFKKDPNNSDIVKCIDRVEINVYDMY